MFKQNVDMLANAHLTIKWATDSQKIQQFLKEELESFSQESITLHALSRR
jgi:hypothetical protein